MFYIKTRNAQYVYYDSGESPSDICINSGVTHLVDSAYCLDPASGTKHLPKVPVNYSFTLDHTITTDLFGFPSYYSFTTIPTDANLCQVTYTLNPPVGSTVPRNLPTGSFDLRVGKNNTFNSDYSNAEKNKFITSSSGNRNGIIQKLVIKESGDCAQIWSILCELIIRIEESMPEVNVDEAKEASVEVVVEEIVIRNEAPESMLVVIETAETTGVVTDDMAIMVVNGEGFRLFTMNFKKLGIYVGRGLTKNSI